MSALDELRGKIGIVVESYCRDYPNRIKHSRKDEKLFRDPIFGFQRLRPYEVLLVDTPIFQRLRGIFQTALAYLTYPSSVHTRFEHSVNAMNLASRILTELMSRGVYVEKQEEAEVRIAALLHDIGHCVFSHGSEFYYRELPEISEASQDPKFSQCHPSEGEIINYCILTSKQFKDLVWDPIKKAFEGQEDFNYLNNVEIEQVAEIIIGAAPEGKANKRYLTDIVNGPIDVDKLDYLRRDGYFTGVAFSVDIDRLLPSLRVSKVKNKELGRDEQRLVVDYRGISVVEQLLFARMLLYDTVYHHHKVRAANSLLQKMLRAHAHRDVWPTTTKRLDTISNLLQIDEYEFFGNKYADVSIQADVDRLRRRILPERALVIAPRALCDRGSHTIWAHRFAQITNRSDPEGVKKGKKYFDEVRNLAVMYAREAGAKSIGIDDITIDIPEPPEYDSLGRETLIQIAAQYCIPLMKFFPFQKAVNNYSEQYKYRSYVFAPEEYRKHVAYAAFRAFKEKGIELNDLALIWAHQETDTKHLFAKFDIEPKEWTKDYYEPTPTEAELDIRAQLRKSPTAVQREIYDILKLQFGE